MWKRAPYILLLACLLATIVARAYAPSDLGRNSDQAKTMSFTVDMVAHGGSAWLLPIDEQGVPSMKPPLVNWLGAPFVFAGLTDEWALKIPSILAGTLIVLLTTWMALHLLRRQEGSKWDHWIAATCGLAVISNTWFIKHVYFARPDMLNVAWLTASWIYGTLALEKRRSPWPFWICIAGALLTKGPTAFISILYVLLAGLLYYRDWGRVRHLKWGRGLALASFPALCWLLAVYFVNPSHVSEHLLSDEVMQRVDSDSGLAMTLLASPEIFLGMLERMSIWAALAFAAGSALWWKHGLKHPLSPTLIWLLSVFLFFAPIAGRASAYYMPAYPALVCLGIVYFCRGAPLRLAVVALAAMVLNGALLHEQYKTTWAARTKAGEAIVQFSRQAKQTVGTDHVSFENMDYAPVSSLMGRHQGSPNPTANAQWTVRLERWDKNSQEQAVLKSRPFARRERSGERKEYLAQLVLIPTE